MEELETGLSILSKKNKFEQEKGKLTGTLGVMFRKNEELKKQLMFYKAKYKTHVEEIGKNDLVYFVYPQLFTP